jgi:hypothetical protein
MKKSQYIVSPATKWEKTIWACDKCKKENTQLILLGEWRLIDRSIDSEPCDLCTLPEEDVA